MYVFYGPVQMALKASLGGFVVNKVLTDKAYTTRITSYVNSL